MFRAEKYLECFLFPDSFFLIFVFSTVNSKFVHRKILPMTGFEQQTSDIASDHSVNWVTTTEVAFYIQIFDIQSLKLKLLFDQQSMKLNFNGKQGLYFPQLFRAKLATNCQSFLKQMGHSRPLFNLFSSFQTNITILTTNILENVMSIKYMTPEFEPTNFGTRVSSHNH